MNITNKIIIAFILCISLSIIGCKEDTIPKPKGYLRLEYPLADYYWYNGMCPFSFEANTLSKIEVKTDCSMTIKYPKMKATIYLTYKPVNNNIDDLLKDTQNLTYKHVIKADVIEEIPYVNNNKKVYGMFYQVGGDAATNAQFYVTDSTRHFLTGSLYFYAKPNFDSIMPAASYIKNDMQYLMESIEWK